MYTVLQKLRVRTRRGAGASGCAGPVGLCGGLPMIRGSFLFASLLCLLAVGFSAADKSGGLLCQSIQPRFSLRSRRSYSSCGCAAPDGRPSHFPRRYNLILFLLSHTSDPAMALSNPPLHQSSRPAVRQDPGPGLCSSSATAGSSASYCPPKKAPKLPPPLYLVSSDASWLSPPKATMQLNSRQCRRLPQVANIQRSRSHAPQPQ